MYLNTIKSQKRQLRLFGNSKTTALRTLITTIFVKRNLDIRLVQFPVVRKPEFHVTYVQSTLNPLAFVVSPYTENALCLLIKPLRVIQVLRREQQRQRIALHHI